VKFPLFTKLFRLSVAVYQRGIHSFLMIEIVGERSVYLGGRQIRILLDDLAGAVAMSYVISCDIDHPMTRVVDTGDTVII
jgi:hypothetical protein